MSLKLLLIGQQSEICSNIVVMTYISQIILMMIISIQKKIAYDTISDPQTTYSFGKYDINVLSNKIIETYSQKKFNIASHIKDCAFIPPLLLLLFHNSFIRSRIIESESQLSIIFTKLQTQKSVLLTKYIECLKHFERTRVDTYLYQLLNSINLSFPMLYGNNDGYHGLWREEYFINLDSTLIFEDALRKAFSKPQKLIGKLPFTLFFHIERKNTQTFKFPYQFDMSPYADCQNEENYTLYGILVKKALISCVTKSDHYYALINLFDEYENNY